MVSAPGPTPRVLLLRLTSGASVVCVRAWCVCVCPEVTVVTPSGLNDQRKLALAFRSGPRDGVLVGCSVWLRRHEAHGDGPGKRSRRGPWDSSGQCGRPTCTRGPARTSLGDMAPAAGARHAGVPPVCHRCARGATRRSVAQGSSARHGRTARGRPLSACTTHFTPCDMATLCGSPRHRRSSGGRRVRWPLSLGGCTLMPMARWRRAWGTATRTLAPQDRGQGSDHVGRCRWEASERPGRHRPAWRCTGTP